MVKRLQSLLVVFLIAGCDNQNAELPAPPAVTEAVQNESEDYWTIAILDDATVVLFDKASIKKNNGEVLGNFVFAYGTPQSVSGLNAMAEVVRVSIRCDSDLVTWKKRLIFEPNATAPVMRSELPPSSIETGTWMREVQQHLCFGAGELEYLSPLPNEARHDLLAALRFGSAMSVETKILQASEASTQ